MLLQIKNNKNFFGFQMNKKGISEMIGYVLLISIAIVISVFVYTWLKTYVPQQNLECPEDVSFLVEGAVCEGSELNITLRNNGLFDIGGYAIHATTDPTQELSTFDLSPYVIGYINGSNLILFGSGNSLSVDNSTKNKFNLDGRAIYSIEVIPIRYQEYDAKTRLVICSNAKIKEEVACS